VVVLSVGSVKQSRSVPGTGTTHPCKTLLVGDLGARGGVLTPVGAVQFRVPSSDTFSAGLRHSQTHHVCLAGQVHSERWSQSCVAFVGSVQSRHPQEDALRFGLGWQRTHFRGVPQYPL